MSTRLRLISAAMFSCSDDSLRESCGPIGGLASDSPSSASMPDSSDLSGPKRPDSNRDSFDRYLCGDQTASDGVGLYGVSML